ncbi:MAG TPA: beta-L-arabinofuranosidase domain-containing protein, partial [Vicinamibacterales bacterium]|nr:beta-L-arabinofuranosidase domain-containing protein [Vicinamibacterales bacterium]
AAALAGALAVAAPPAATARRIQEGYRIQPVPFTDVHLEDTFWAPKIETNRRVTIPFAFEQCERTGRVDLFERAARARRGEPLENRKPPGYPFDDTDVYKVIEGAAYTLSVHHDPKLEAYVDGLIAKIAAAQEPDGYLYTTRTIDPKNPHPWAGRERWELERDDSHELYNLGHLFEAAVAHHLATGKRTLLDVATKAADLLARTFGPGKRSIWPGHQGVEMGLVRLYRVTGNEAYLTLAKFMLDQRGPSPGEKTNPRGLTYNQAHLPVTEQTEPVGHAVRATYMYAGMADVAALTGDTAYIRALDRIWTRLVSTKLYITGGIGATGRGEAFGGDYELPNLTAYNETCASVGHDFWNHRMFLLHGDAKYVDVMERTLYNALLSGVSLDGTRFFYPNPLESTGQHQRSPWFGVACCPGNITRFLPSVPGYFYAREGATVYVNLFAAGRAEIAMPGGWTLRLVQSTRYPWEGDVRIAVDPGAERRFALKVRIPGWARNEVVPSDLYRFLDPAPPPPVVRLNGQAVPLALDRGYVTLERAWRPGDAIDLHLPMPVRRVVAHERVEADRGRVALQRGPIVYAAEWPDNPGGRVRNLVLPDDVPLTSRFRPDLLDGVQVVEGRAVALAYDAQGGITRKEQPFVAIPYHTWANRGPGEMIVWIARTEAHARPAPYPTLATRSTVTTSGRKNPRPINDGEVPASSDDPTAYFDWWPRRGTTEWVEMVFPERATVAAVELYWFDDTGRGQVRVPASWRLLYRDGGEWQPVRATSPYGVEKDRFNRVTFEPVTTDALRLEVTMQPEWSAGIQEWRVERAPASSGAQARSFGGATTREAPRADGAAAPAPAGDGAARPSSPGSSRAEAKGRPAAEASETAPAKDLIDRSARLAARPLPLDAVRLTGGPLKHAQDLIARYLLQLEPDRMLAYYRIRAGLSPRAEPYDGWDGDGRNLTGHIAGHYLSAVSLMWAATGDTRFKQRADYIVGELAEVQKRHGDGYLGALARGREAFAEVSKGNIRATSFDLNGLWSPWYVLHKTFAGLRDAYRLTGNRTALEVEVRFAEWAERVLAPLTDEQVQTMLGTEFGGMNEVLADLYADTGDRRWLALSDRFEHRAVLDPLKRGEDPLAGLHGNTQVPKLVGSLARYLYVGRPEDLKAAAFFWERVARHHTFATGGHGKDEYFREPDRLANIVDGRTAETCNVYNMLKLTRGLFAVQPRVEYAEFHERALFNHILGSIDPNDGSVCYMVPVGRGVAREYQDMFRSFTCCVGTGMESHALHGYGIYYVADGAVPGGAAARRLWVNLYAPSTAEWREAGVRLDVETNFPEGEAATLRVRTAEPTAFTLLLRRPAWAGDGFAVTVNGEPLGKLPAPGSYVEIDRVWRTGDVVAVRLPKRLRLEPLSGDPSVAAILWGPLVLAGDLGPQPERGRDAPRPEVPVLVAAGRPVDDWVRPVADRPGAFRTEGVGRPRDVELLPFYRLHRRLYAAYWDVITPAEYERRMSEAAAERERVRRLEAATVVFVPPGDEAREKSFGLQGEQTSIVRVERRAGRRAGRWFSYELPIEPGAPLALVVTYHSDQRRPRSFEILIDGRKIADERLEASSRARFFDVEYPIPPDRLAGRTTITVRFQAAEGSEVPGVFGVRVIRKSPS